MTTPSETVLANLLSKIQFNNDGLVPVMAVSHTSGTLLMQAWADADAVKEAVKTGTGVYFSRSRGQMWRKGESSGHAQKLHGIRLDCDGDSLVYLVDQTGPACHLDHPSCFHWVWEEETWRLDATSPAGGSSLGRVSQLVHTRIQNADHKTSYVASLRAKGTEAIAEKISEESQEVVEAALNESKERLVMEVADLWFHSMVLLVNAGADVADVERELQRRFGTSGLTEKASRKS